MEGSATPRLVLLEGPQLSQAEGIVVGDGRATASGSNREMQCWGGWGGCIINVWT